MIKFLRFLTSRKSFLVFVLLELISIILIIKTHNYAQLKTHNLETALSGSFNQKIAGINQYLYLKQYNDSLLKQNAILINKLFNIKQDRTPFNLPNNFEIIPAYVISNQYHFDYNTLLINKGEANGVLPEMGIITQNGIIGITQKTSDHFARIVSILNKKSKINVALIHTNYTGFLKWSKNDPNEFEIIDMPENANISLGDTIITSGFSNIFPKNIPIGTIIGFNTVPGRKSYIIKMKTLIDMTNIGPVYIIKNNFKQEIDSLKLN